MRIPDAILPYFSIVWFGIDAIGHIAAFLSCGEGNIPEFVLESEEETMTLFHHWYGHRACSFSQTFDFRNSKDHSIFTNSGLYVYLCNDPYDGGIYRLKKTPSVPAYAHTLPESIREILHKHILPASFADQSEIYIP